MKTVHEFSESEVLERARDHDCPSCGAGPGVRCRTLTYGGWSGGGRTKVDVKQEPCPERVTLAWRRTLAEGGREGLRWRMSPGVFVS